MGGREFGRDAVTAADRIIRARSALILSQPFFGSLALRLELAERPDVTDTMAVDGRRLFFNAAFVLSLSEPELIGTIAHEVMHCALRHFARRGGRDLEEWNTATDYAINPILRDAGFVLPAGVLNDPKLANLSAEEIHAHLFGRKPDLEPEPAGADAAEPEDGDGEEDGAGGAGDDESEEDDGGAGADGGADGSDGSDGDADGSGDGDADGGAPGDGTGSGDADGSGDGDGSEGSEGTGAGAGGRPTPGNGQGTGSGSPGVTCPDPGRCGGVIDADAIPADDGAAGDAADLETQWEVYTRQAINAATRAAGSLPGFLERVVQDLNAPRIDWRDVLRRFIDQSVVRDYTWSRPNRRHIARGVILPGMVSDSLSHVVVVLDTSGSIDDGILRAFLSEIGGAMADGIADRVTIVHCDCVVHRADVFERGDGIPADLRPVGGRGTAFAPAFAWIRDNAPDASAVIYFTDLECSAWGAEPDAPLLWAAWGDPWRLRQLLPRVPFGEVITLPAE